MIEVVFIATIIYIIAILYKKSNNVKRIQPQSYTPYRPPYQHKIDIESKGIFAERRLIHDLLQCGIPNDYIFHNLYFHISYDQYSQADIIVATNVGIIVFEVKNYSGWIFGNGYHNKWTQVLAYGAEKNQFYNPILQNQTHIDIIRKQLPQFQNIPFFSVIVFFGDCTLKEISNIPPNTYVIYASQVRIVMQEIFKTNSPAPYTNTWEILNLFKQASINGENQLVVNMHQNNINNRYGNSHFVKQ